MPTIQEMKAQSPAYAALTDQEFADRVYAKHYAGKISREEFDRRTAPVSIAGETINAFTKGVNQGVDGLLNIPSSIINAGSEALGFGEAIPPINLARRANVEGFEPRTAVGRAVEAGGEVLGGSLLPTAGIVGAGARVGARGASALQGAAREISQRAVTAPGAFATSEAVSALGAGAGIEAARAGELGPVGEFVGGMAGGFAGPAAVSLGARTGAGVRDAANYSSKMLRRARDPQTAAIENVSDRLVGQGISPDELRAQITPSPSPALASRGIDGEDIAEMIARKSAGETLEDIAKSYGKLSPATVGRYLQKYEANNPTPRNIVDISKDLKGEGAASPIARLARASASLADDGEAAQRLLGRQQTQSGRVVDIIERGSGGVKFEDEIARLSDVTTRQAREAYKRALQNAKPFNLRPVIRKYRQGSFSSGGEVRSGLNRALDLFFNPVMAERGGKIAYNKLGTPIADLKRFQGARQELDQMIARSKQDGQSTPLTAQLTQLRRDLTKAARASNPDLAEADDLFSGAKSAQRLLDEGAKLTTRLGAQSRKPLAQFAKLSPDQKELFRIGFLRKLADMASNIRDGAGVSNQFQSPAVRKTIEQLFPKSDPKAWKRGQDLINALKQEATTTRTKNDILAGSRTAELAGDMERMSEGARAAADLATGRFGALLQNLSTRLTTQLGEEGAKATLRILTETEPAKLLPILNQLARAAKTSAERKALVASIRDFKIAKPIAPLGVAPGLLDEEGN